MLKTTLRAYQDPAVDRFLERGNLLLAFDPGVGKTLTAIGAAEDLLGTGKIGTCLIVCPAGLRLQWAQNIAKHTDVATTTITVKGVPMTIPTEDWCVVLDGEGDKRTQQLKRVKAEPPQYVIAGYETAAEHYRAFLARAQMTVIDEATVLSSRTSKRARRLRKLMTDKRLALTATPVEHRPENIFGIMEWVDPAILGDFEDFDKAYVRRNHWGKPVRYVNLDVLHEKLEPAMVRKTIHDPDVAPYMPKAEYVTWYADMDPRMRKAYVHIARDLDKELKKLQPGESFDLAAYYGGYDEGSKAGKVMAVYAALQMLLDHPALVRDSAEDYIRSEKQRKSGVVKKNWPGSAYAEKLVDSQILTVLHSSPKFRLLTSNLRKLLDDPDNKVIVVSRYKGMQELITDAIPVKVGIARYHGDMTGQAKAAAVTEFETNPDCRLLLMSHAGAYGVDLPAANVLINYDPALSAGQRTQINGRHQRASSEHEKVLVVDMVTRDTIEERQYARLDVKDAVGTAIVDGVGAEAGGVIRLSTESLTAHVEIVLSEADSDRS